MGCCCSGFAEQKRRSSKSLLRQLSQLSRKSIDSLSSSLSTSSPRTPSPRGTISEFSVACELLLISALQGARVPCGEIQNCAVEIGDLNQHEKQRLINFFKIDGDAPGIIENNAFKTFVCSHLTTECLLANVDGLISLWKQLRHGVIPTIQAMCYPLVEFDATFDSQKLILTAFRDRVLAKLLQDIDKEIPELHPILFSITLETDGICPFLKEKIDICMGNQMKPRYLKKTRSKTDSCVPNKPKSVSWVDARKSSTFCL
ncbi:unnamed protein product [Caenorhabditis bovis]|uniref:Uncharacterized protein n=1 Tax=Caenorhabditis bovis TaxID=2654633 RepID=A0A8S1ENU1_9PELO|nr:unnamed protein product [Caenorhabditis bovis]